MTKPAGCFLQLMGGIGILLSAVMLTQPEVPPWLAGAALVGSMVLIYAGGRPARRK
jgi:hypothetical protein